MSTKIKGRAKCLPMVAGGGSGQPPHNMGGVAGPPSGNHGNAFSAAFNFRCRQKSKAALNAFPWFPEGGSGQPPHMTVAAIKGDSENREVPKILSSATAGFVGCASRQPSSLLQSPHKIVHGIGVRSGRCLRRKIIKNLQNHHISAYRTIQMKTLSVLEPLRCE